MSSKSPEADSRSSLDATEQLERRIALALTAVATGWFTLAAAWGLFGPLLAGHYASSASVGIISDNMWRWRIGGPVWEYTAARPRPEQYYCHHPWGIFWTTAAFMKVLGRHDYVCRLPAVLLSAATPPLLYLLGRALWRPAAGAIAAVSFVVLPITLAFAHFNALEVPVIAWSTMGLWGWVRHQQTWRRRYLVVSLVGFAFALHADWPAYVLVAVLLAHGLVRFFFSRGVSFRAHAQAWALTASMCAVTLLFYAYLFHRSDKLGDLMQSYEHRSLHRGASLAQVLADRRYWIELSFTPVALVVGAVGTIVCLGRFVTLRKTEIAPLAVLAMALVQYFVFEQGADIHIYWPHYFAAFFALGMAAIGATVLALVPARWMAMAIAIVLLPLVAILRDGVGTLGYARASGGRFNEKGLFIESEGDKIAFIRWLAPSLDPTGVVALHASMKANWSQTWAFGGRVVAVDAPLFGRAHFSAIVADARRLDERDKERLVSNRHVVALGPYWYVIPDEPAGAIDAYSFVEREPGFFTWYFVDGTEPIRGIEPDPYLTWELRTHFNQPADTPAEPPTTFEQRRIAHNMAIARGDHDDATSLERALLAELSEPRTPLPNGAELLGVRFERGVQPVITLVLRGGPGVIEPALRSKVIAPPAWSTTMADPTEREVGAPLAIAPARWRDGFLYSYRAVLRKRPGRERFVFSWGSARVPVLEL